MPALTEPSSPSGLPMASTVSPTSRSALLPSVAGVSPSTSSAWMTARSVAGSRPTISASARGAVGERDASGRRRRRPRATTWLLVRIWPSELMTTPEPLPAQLARLEADRHDAGQHRGGRLRQRLVGACRCRPRPASTGWSAPGAAAVVVEARATSAPPVADDEHQAGGREHRHRSPAPPRGRRRDRRTGGGPVAARGRRGAAGAGGDGARRRGRGGDGGHRRHRSRRAGRGALRRRCTGRRAAPRARRRRARRPAWGRRGPRGGGPCARPSQHRENQAWWTAWSRRSWRQRWAPTLRIGWTPPGSSLDAAARGVRGAGPASRLPGGVQAAPRFGGHAPPRARPTPAVPSCTQDADDRPPPSRPTGGRPRRACWWSTTSPTSSSCCRRACASPASRWRPP